MPIYLLPENEPLQAELNGTIFYYRHLLDAEILKLKTKNSFRGVLDVIGYRRDLLTAALTGWGGAIYDQNGESVEFKPELIALLPHWNQEALQNIIESGMNINRPEGDAEKN